MAEDSGTWCTVYQTVMRTFIFDADDAPVVEYDGIEHRWKPGPDLRAWMDTRYTPTKTIFGTITAFYTGHSCEVSVDESFDGGLLSFEFKMRWC